MAARAILSALRGIQATAATEGQSACRYPSAVGRTRFNQHRYQHTFVGAPSLRGDRGAFPHGGVCCFHDIAIEIREE